jgi:hypothetical protein
MALTGKKKEPDALKKRPKVSGQLLEGNEIDDCQVWEKYVNANERAWMTQKH